MTSQIVPQPPSLAWQKIGGAINVAVSIEQDTGIGPTSLAVLERMQIGEDPIAAGAGELEEGAATVAIGNRGAVQVAGTVPQLGLLPLGRISERHRRRVVWDGHVSGSSGNVTDTDRRFANEATMSLRDS